MADFVSVLLNDARSAARVPSSVAISATVCWLPTPSACMRLPIVPTASSASDSARPMLSAASFAHWVTIWSAASPKTTLTLLCASSRSDASSMA